MWNVKSLVQINWNRRTFLTFSLHWISWQKRIEKIISVSHEEMSSPRVRKMSSEILLNENQGNIVEWPGNYPDLKPIKNLLFICKQRLRGMDCTTMKLIQVLIRVQTPSRLFEIGGLHIKSHTDINISIWILVHEYKSSTWILFIMKKSTKLQNRFLFQLNCTKCVWLSHHNCKTLPSCDEAQYHVLIEVLGILGNKLQQQIHQY